MGDEEQTATVKRWVWAVAAFVIVMSASYWACGDLGCLPIARREALAYVQRTQVVGPGSVAVFCQTAPGSMSQYRCTVTPRGGVQVRLECRVFAVWEVSGCFRNDAP